MKIIQKEHITPTKNLCGKIFGLHFSQNLDIAIADITTRTKPHKHEKMEEVYYVLNGSGTIFIGHEKQTIAKGDLIPIPKHEFHHVETDPGVVMEVLVVTHPKFDPNDVIEEDAT